jgi:hypothetical protein
MFLWCGDLPRLRCRSVGASHSSLLVTCGSHDTRAEPGGAKEGRVRGERPQGEPWGQWGGVPPCGLPPTGVSRPQAGPAIVGAGGRGVLAGGPCSGLIIPGRRLLGFGACLAMTVGGDGDAWVWRVSVGQPWVWCLLPASVLERPSVGS